MAKNVTLAIPSWIRSPDDFAKFLMDGNAFSELGRELYDIIYDHRSITDDLDRIRETLVLFGALEEQDHATGVADLLDVLLPAVEP